MKPIFLCVLIICADAEWEIVCKKGFRESKCRSPYGQWFTEQSVKNELFKYQLIYFHGGWGKVAAAGSTQFVIDRWKPDLLVNLGTCGGLRGKVKKGEVLLAEKTIIYDIYEQMGDPQSHIDHYQTLIDLSWITKPPPIPVLLSTLISGDRDLQPTEIDLLMSKYQAFAGDWESGAIAWVAARNRVPLLILRGVSDLIDSTGGEAYDGNINVFYENTNMIMNRLLDSLPKWISIYQQSQSLANQNSK